MFESCHKVFVRRQRLRQWRIAKANWFDRIWDEKYRSDLDTLRLDVATIKSLNLDSSRYPTRKA